MTHAQIEGVLAKQFPAPKRTGSESADNLGGVLDFMGGVGGELWDAGKGLVSAVASPPADRSENIASYFGPALPVFRMLKGEKESRGKAFSQAGEMYRNAKGMSSDPFAQLLERIRATATGAAGVMPLPGVPGMATHINELEDEGKAPEAWGRGLTDIAMLGSGLKAKNRIQARASEIDPVSGTERLVRKKVVPGFRPVNDRAFKEMVKIAREPDILPAVAEYARRTGNPLRDELQVARAAQDVGKEISGYYQEHLIDPNADILAGRTGKTVGQAYKRLGEINKILQPAHLKGTIGPEITGQALIDLQREAAELNEGVYSTLSERSGLPVDQVRRINQRGASTSQLGKELEASRNALEQGVSGYDAVGNAIPHTPYHPVFQAITKAVNGLRGGEVAIADRALRKSVKSFPKGFQELPNPDDISRYRRMVERSDLSRVSSKADLERGNQIQREARRSAAGYGEIKPTNKDSFLKPQEIDPTKVLANRAQSLAERKAAIEQRGTALEQAKQVKATEIRRQQVRQQQLLAKARERQEQARVARGFTKGDQ